MRHYILLLLVFILSLFLLSSEKILTVAEASNFTQTSLYSDVMSFLYKIQRMFPWVRIVKLTTSIEGRMIPLVILSKERFCDYSQARLHGKPSVLIMANIHAGEVEGKEAAQMLIRDISTGDIASLLDHQVLLVIPIFNADGNDKLDKNNRRDNGPELAGVRYNGQHLDLNRDYIKLDSPEVRALIQVFKTWDPVLFVDMHTTNGSYHREPVTYTTLSNPNCDKRLQDYMWNKFFPEVSKILKRKYGFDSVPYGNFVDRANPEKGWANHAFAARYGSNYVGLRNRFTVLDENYSRADFKTRVMASYYFIRSILEYTNKHIDRMQELVLGSDKLTSNHYRRERFILKYKPEKLFDLTVKSFEFEKEEIKPEDRKKYPPWIGKFLVKPTPVLKDYKVPYFARPVSTLDIRLPEGYIILPFYERVINNLKHHGIVLEKLQEGFRCEAERFHITKVESTGRLYQGQVLHKISGQAELTSVDFPAGSFFISMKQPLARLVAQLLEAECEDGLLTWGFFNRVIVRQWGARPGFYPVYRIFLKPPVPLIVE